MNENKNLNDLQFFLKTEIFIVQKLFKTMNTILDSESSFKTAENEIEKKN